MNLPYITILLLILISAIVVSLPFITNFIISKAINKKYKKNLNSQLESYECGMVPTSDARFNFPIKFALVAILFIIFNLELIFLFPWSLIWTGLSKFAQITMIIFLLILTIGLIYAWKKGALEWKK